MPQDAWPEGCGAGALAGEALWNTSGLNTADFFLGATSLSTTALSDYLYDGSFGEATGTSYATFITGSATWDPIVDFAIDGYASGYNKGSFCGVFAIVNGDC